MTDGHHREIHPGDHAHAHEAHLAPAGPHPSDSEEFDSELNIRAILWTTGGVVAICIVSVIAMWGMFVGFDAFDRRNAAKEPPAMTRATATMRQQAPPGPLLQASPSEDMTAMSAENALLLQHAGWVDRAQGTVRLPIGIAIDLLAARGLPKVTTPPLAEMAAHGSTADDGRPPTDQPSPGTLLPPPGMGIGNLGPPAAGAGQQFAPAMPEPAAAAAPAGPRQPAAQPRQPARNPARKPILPPPPPPGGMP